MIYVRGHPADYDGWKSLGCEGWGWDEMRPCFAALEGDDAGPGERREALLKLSTPAEHTPLSEAFLRAAAQAGAPRVEDLNAAPDGGFGYQPRTIWGGRRQSAAQAFLRPAAGRANLMVLTDTDVLKVLFTGRRASAVLVRDAAGERQVAARREVILTAGAIASPAHRG